MASQGFSRKRSAPGADPVSYPAQMPNPTSAYNDPMGKQLSNDQFLQWGQTGQSNSGKAYNGNSYDLKANSHPQRNPPNVPQPWNQQTRRPMAQFTSVGPQANQDRNTWINNTNGGGHTRDADWGDDIADLKAKAQVAKKGAQAKRKHIPPFVLKLNR